MNNEIGLPKDLKRIEKRLQEALQPIQPPALFVKDLRSKLDQEMRRKRNSKKVRVGLLIAGGVVGLTALAITLIRSLTSWEKISDSISRIIPRQRKREGAASI